jgi:citrate/tricarballylate utilization protein
MDTAFIVMLFLSGLTGLALLVLRDTAAMGMLLAVHLGVVFALFLTLPYGKFVHGLYRFLALVRYAREHRATAGDRSE